MSERKANADNNEIKTYLDLAKRENIPLSQVENYLTSRGIDTSMFKAVGTPPVQEAKTQLEKIQKRGIPIFPILPMAGSLKFDTAKFEEQEFDEKRGVYVGKNRPKGPLRALAGYADFMSAGLTDFDKLGGGFLYTRFPDNSIIAFGTGSDLQIYHDGSNSIIKDGGTGHLNIQGTNIQLLNSVGNKYYATFADGAQVKLFYNGVEKLETQSTGIKISGVSEYADNTAAIAGGLTTGDVYRTGDLLKIVH